MKDWKPGPTIILQNHLTGRNSWSEIVLPPAEAVVGRVVVVVVGAVVVFEVPGATVVPESALADEVVVAKVVVVLAAIVEDVGGRLVDDVEDVVPEFVEVWLAAVEDVVASDAVVIVCSRDLGPLASSDLLARFNHAICCPRLLAATSRPTTTEPSVEISAVGVSSSRRALFP